MFSKQFKNITISRFKLWYDVWPQLICYRHILLGREASISVEYVEKYDLLHTNGENSCRINESNRNKWPNTLVSRTHFIRPVERRLCCEGVKSVQTTESWAFYLYTHIFRTCERPFLYFLPLLRTRSAEDVEPYPNEDSEIVCMGKVLRCLLLVLLFGLSLYASNHCWCSFLCGKLYTTQTQT